MTLNSDRTRHYPIISFLKEAALVLLLGTAVLLAYATYAAFETVTPAGFKWVPVLFALSPVFFVYLFLRFAFGSIVAATMTFTATCALIAINDYKTALTGAPLSWSDMTNADNIAMSSKFVSLWSLLLLGVLLLVAGVFAWRRACQQLANRSMRSAFMHIAALLMLSPIALQPYVVNISPKADAKLMDTLNRFGIMYFSWDWAENVRMNGFPMHLIQTSHRSIPSMPKEQDYQSLATLTPVADTATPKHIFFILCEACWYDDTHFTDVVKPLDKLGFKSLRGVSPAYGGGTANAAFEMLTSLPSRGALQGVIYQEYAALMKEQTLTIPSQLQDRGYRTFALHNFSKTFWQRHVVMEKLGFDQFLGIEDMHYDGPMYFPRDAVLYKSALALLKKHSDTNAFFNLETVYSHASYDTSNDDGQADYARRLSVAMQDLSRFVTDVRKISPDALFVVYGDHKPILTKYFYDTGVLPASMFIATGEGNGDFSFAHNASQAILGDVPVWIGSTDTARMDQVAARADNKPFYCVSAAIDDVFIASLNPASRFAMSDTCPNYAPDQYRAAAKTIPPWLYALSLFDPDNKERFAAIDESINGPLPQQTR